MYPRALFRSMHPIALGIYATQILSILVYIYHDIYIYSLQMKCTQSIIHICTYILGRIQRLRLHLSGYVCYLYILLGSKYRLLNSYYIVVGIDCTYHSLHNMLGWMLNTHYTDKHQSQYTLVQIDTALTNAGTNVHQCQYGLSARPRHFLILHAPLGRPKPPQVINTLEETGVAPWRPVEGSGPGSSGSELTRVRGLG